MRSTYWLARGYAYKLDPQNSGDLVHQAYLVWWEKKQRNLLLERPETIASVIKYLWKAGFTKRKLRLGDRFKGPITYDKVHIPIEDSGINPSGDSDPVSQIVFNDMKNRVLKIVNRQQGKILKLLISGYTQVEVSKELDMSPQLVNKRLQEVRNVFYGKDAQYR